MGARLVAPAHPRRRRRSSSSCVVVAVSCGGGTGGRADVPVVEGSADAGRDRRPGAVGPAPAARCGWSPQRSTAWTRSGPTCPGVWNLMRLYTRTLVTYSSDARAHRRAGAGPGDRPRDAVSKDGLSWTFTLRTGVQVRERPADHVPRRQVRHRAVLRLRGHRRRPHLRRRPARRSRQPVRRARTRTRRRTSSACRRSQTPDDAHDRLQAPRPAARPARSSWRCPRAARCRSRPTPGPATARHPVSSGPYAITSVDPATGIVLDRNPQWDPATDDVRTRAARPGRRPHRADRASSATRRCWPDRPTSTSPAPACRPRRPSRLAADEDDPVHGRVDDVTTGARPAARHADRRRPDGQRRLPGRGGRGGRPQGGAECARRPGQRRPPLAAVAPGAAGRAARTATRGPISTPPGRTCGLRSSRRVLDGARRRRHVERCRRRACGRR